MSIEKKSEASGAPKETAKPKRGFMSIPKGEIEDMERERKRVARKPTPTKPKPPKK